jgi:biopolymer transport protein ExbB
MVELMMRGGPLMWPLLACSVAALTVILERFLFWIRTEWQHDKTLLSRIFELTEAGRFEEAAEAAEGSRCATARVLIAGLTHRNYGLQDNLESAAASFIAQMRRGLSVLDTIITLAPLLGILGTVSGIIQSFDLLGQAGIEDPKAVTGGIAQALLTTAAGLTVAIVTLIPYNALVRKVEKTVEALEKLCTHYTVTVQKGAENNGNLAK